MTEMQTLTLETIGPFKWNQSSISSVNVNLSVTSLTGRECVSGTLGLMFYFSNHHLNWIISSIVSASALYHRWVKMIKDPFNRFNSGVRTRDATLAPSKKRCSDTPATSTSTARAILTSAFGKIFWTTDRMRANSSSTSAFSDNLSLCQGARRTRRKQIRPRGPKWKLVNHANVICAAQSMPSLV